MKSEEEGATLKVPLKVPLVDDRRLSEGNILDTGSSKRQKPLTSRSQPVSPHTERSNRTKRDPSPTPSSSSETSSLVEQVSASRPPPLPCTVGEKVSSVSHMEGVASCPSLYVCSLYHPHDTQVMVEIANGFKIGVVKFIGETEFAPGEWIGVALERPNGELLLFNLCPFLSHQPFFAVQANTKGQ